VLYDTERQSARTGERRSAGTVSISEPVTELTDPSPAVARRAVAEAAARTNLGRRETDGLVLGVSEVVANAHLHGAPPVHVAIRETIGAVEVRVTDAGRGPDDLAVGEGVVAPDATSGRGLWLARRSCAEVALLTDSAGFSVRLTARERPA